MATTMQKLSTFTVENKEFYEKALLDRLINDCVFYPYAKKAVLPKGNGTSISWRIFKSLEVPSAGLTEGVVPDGKDLNIVEFKATVAQEGSYVELSDKIDYFGIDPVVTETAELLGEQSAQRLEDIIKTKIFAGLNVYYAQGTSSAQTVYNGGSVKTITLGDINKIAAMFKRQNVKPYANGKYIAFIPPEIEADIKTLADMKWIEINRYNANEKIEKGEIGSFLGFKWVVTNQIAEHDTYSGVYECLFMGKDAFGAVDVEGGGAKPAIIHKGLGSAGTADPLNQKQTLGWKVMGFCTRILHEEALCRYVVGASTVADARTFIVDANRSHYNAANTGTTVTVTKTNGTNTTITQTGTAAIGQLVGFTVAATSTHALASSAVWTTASFVGCEIVSGSADTTTIVVKVTADAVTVVSANAAS